MKLISIWVLEEDFNLIKETAKQLRLPVSAFCRTSVMHKVMRPDRRTRLKPSTECQKEVKKPGLIDEKQASVEAKKKPDPPLRKPQAITPHPASKKPVLDAKPNASEANISTPLPDAGRFPEFDEPRESMEEEHSLRQPSNTNQPINRTSRTDRTRH